jgi:hypothetical protein
MPVSTAVLHKFSDAIDSKGVVVNEQRIIDFGAVNDALGQRWDGFEVTFTLNENDKTL